MKSYDCIKSRLKSLKGETFRTVTGKEYTYEFVGEGWIVTSRTEYKISLSDFEKAIQVAPKSPGEISNLVRGSSYIFGIITDPRFN